MKGNIDNYKTVLAELLGEHNYTERDRYSKDDFVSITCPEHGIYYKSIGDILKGDVDCPRCNFLHPGRMFNTLVEARKDLPVSDIDDPRALFYRILVEHKRTGLIFQKIGISESIEDFNNFWNPWKWKDFIIEHIDKIECTEAEANAILKKFQEDNIDLKMTVPNNLKFNLNKTYHWEQVWQSKSKTIPILREIMLQKNHGLCSICNKPVKAETLDHMHVKRIHGTGYIRDVCCSLCNTFIARSENNAMRHSISNQELPNVLRNMADHLEKQTKIIHPTEVPKRKKVGVREWNKVRKYYFKVFPRRKTLPDKPTYVTNKWLELKEQIDDFIKDEEEKRSLKRNKKKAA